MIKTPDLFRNGLRREGFAFLPLLVGLALLGTLVGVGVSLMKPRAKIEKVIFRKYRGGLA